ncbi:MAG: beta-ketoacyl synthase N-terminal-like domain-containing protein [Acidobacteriota bacterium]
MSRGGGACGPVVISGLGCVSPLGLNTRDMLAACMAGRTAIRPIEKIDGLSGMPLFAAAVPAFDVEEYLRFPRNAKFMKRPVECAIAAAYQAIRNSGLEWNGIDPERVSLFTACGQTNVEYHTFFPALEVAWEECREDNYKEDNYKYVGRREARILDRYFSLSTLANGGLAFLSLELGARGSASNHAQGDAAFATALRSATFDLLDRRCDIALAGAYDSLLTASNVLAYSEAGLLSSGSYRPFDRDRGGIVLGEGAAFFVLERLEDARRRGAAELSSIAGIGSIHDCSRSVGIGWQTDDMAAVLDAAEVSGDQCDYAIANGFGTPEADRSESEAWNYAGANDLPLTALKGLTGYLGAATPAVELAIALTCSRAGFVPPVTGCELPDPEFRLNLIRSTPCRLRLHGAAGLFISRSVTGQISALSVRNL